MTISQRWIRSCGLSSRGTARSRSRSSPPMPFAVRVNTRSLRISHSCAPSWFSGSPQSTGSSSSASSGQDGSFARHHGSSVMSRRPPFQRIHHSAVSL